MNQSETEGRPLSIHTQAAPLAPASAFLQGEWDGGGEGGLGGTEDPYVPAKITCIILLASHPPISISTSMVMYW